MSLRLTHCLSVKSHIRLIGLSREGEVRKIEVYHYCHWGSEGRCECHSLVRAEEKSPKNSPADLCLWKEFSMHPIPKVFHFATGIHIHQRTDIVLSPQFLGLCWGRGLCRVMTAACLVSSPTSSSETSTSSSEWLGLLPGSLLRRSVASTQTCLHLPRVDYLTTPWGSRETWTVNW